MDAWQRCRRLPGRILFSDPLEGRAYLNDFESVREQKSLRGEKTRIIARLEARLCRLVFRRVCELSRGRALRFLARTMGHPVTADQRIQWDRAVSRPRAYCLPNSARPPSLPDKRTIKSGDYKKTKLAKARVQTVHPMTPSLQIHERLTQVPIEQTGMPVSNRLGGAIRRCRGARRLRRGVHQPTIDPLRAVAVRCVYPALLSEWSVLIARVIYSDEGISASRGSSAVAQQD